jgi:opacity protein-like surface antigen
MKKITLAIMAIASFAGAKIAFASDDGWYMFGAIGQITGSGDKSMLDHVLTSAGKNGFSSSLSKPTVYSLDVGYQINKNLAFEGGYIGSTNETYEASGGNLAGSVTASARISGWTVTAVGMLPLAKQFSLLGKLGVAEVQDTANVTGLVGNNEINGIKSDITYGVGAKYDFTNAISMRIDLDNYNIGSSFISSRCNIWTVGVGYKF